MIDDEGRAISTTAGLLTPDKEENNNTNTNNNNSNNTNSNNNNNTNNNNNNNNNNNKSSDFDPNNNKVSLTPSRRGRRGLSKTYGLRPRTGIRRPLIDSDPPELKISFSRRGSRGGGERHQPLSKYRRKTANARERGRMKDINDAFSTLRKVLPPVNTRRTATITSMTKITTLKLAVAYIRALSEILDEDDTIPSETTITLLNAANLHIWNETSTHYQIPSQVPSISHSQTQAITSNTSQMIHKPTLLQMTNDNNYQPNFCESQKDEKPFWETNNVDDKSLVFATSSEQNNFDDNLSFWEEIPLLTDFPWSLT